MANIRLIRRRIGSAKNIAQITKAMEMVSASKMRKSQATALSGKLYASKIHEMVMRLSSVVDISHDPLLVRPKAPSGKRIIICISTNKGLCGGLNANLFRFFLSTYPEGKKHGYVTVGAKGAAMVTHTGGELLADFSGTLPFTASVPALTELIRTRFLSQEYDAVDLLFNGFVSILRQVPVRKTILPLTIGSRNESTDERTARDMLIEPNTELVLQALLPHYLENQIRDAILQAEASEHSARMIAMRNATDNALSLMEDLTLLYNKARQEKITYEISDMVTARMAVAN